MGAFDVLTAEPTSIVAGDTVWWRRDDLAATYPPALYDLSYVAIIKGPTLVRITIAAAADGGGYVVALPSATTAAYVVGTYVWGAFLTRKIDGARASVAVGEWSVAANPATTTADPRSHDERMLAAIEAVLEGRAAKDVEEYEIAGRRLKRIPIRELRALRESYRRKVAAASGGAARFIRRVSFS